MFFNLFNTQPINIEEILEKIKDGAQVIDVRSGIEFAGGHSSDAINIPITTIHTQIDRLKSLNKPLVFCCATGSRSNTVKKYLDKLGFEEVYNGGSWKRL